METTAELPPPLSPLLLSSAFMKPPFQLLRDFGLYFSYYFRVLIVKLRESET